MAFIGYKTRVYLSKIAANSKSGLFIGGAFVGVPQCYPQNLFNGDAFLISKYFMLRSALVLVLCLVLLNF